MRRWSAEKKSLIKDYNHDANLEIALASDGVHGPFGFEEMGGIDFVTFPFLPHRL
jgi:hypothetical protein